MLPGKRDERATEERTPALSMRGNDFLTAKEVATRLRVCTATVYKLCASGALPHVRVLNAVRVATDDLERFVSNRNHP